MVTPCLACEDADPNAVQDFGQMQQNAAAPGFAITTLNGAKGINIAGGGAVIVLSKGRPSISARKFEVALVRQPLARAAPLQPCTAARDPEISEDRLAGVGHSQGHRPRLWEQVGIKAGTRFAGLGTVEEGLAFCSIM